MFARCVWDGLGSVSFVWPTPFTPARWTLPQLPHRYAPTCHGSRGYAITFHYSPLPVPTLLPRLWVRSRCLHPRCAMAKRSRYHLALPWDDLITDFIAADLPQRASPPARTHGWWCSPYAPDRWTRWCGKQCQNRSTWTVCWVYGGRFVRTPFAAPTGVTPGGCRRPRHYTAPA